MAFNALILANSDIAQNGVKLLSADTGEEVLLRPDFDIVFTRKFKENVTYKVLCVRHETGQIFAYAVYTYKKKQVEGYEYAQIRETNNGKSLSIEMLGDVDLTTYTIFTSLGFANLEDINRIFFEDYYEPGTAVTFGISSAETVIKKAVEDSQNFLAKFRAPNNEYKFKSLTILKDESTTN